MEELDNQAKGAAITVLLGGGLLILGSFLPWAKVTTAFGSIGVSGMDGGDGIFTVIAGILIALVGLAALTGSQMPKLLRGSPIGCAIIALGVTILDHQNISSGASDLTAEAGGFAAATIGAGIWVLYIGGIISLIGAISLLRAPEGGPATTGLRGTSRECPHCKERMRRDASVCPHCQRDSEPWRLHDGRWWVKRGDEDYYFEEARNEWVKFEREPSSEALV